jgi:FixJ family two-component response regulator
MQRRTANTGSSKVYIVDDDAAFQTSLGWLLESVGRSFEACSSAEKFLEIHDPNQVGCLILDFRLPGMSGLALLEELRTRGSCLPVIVLSGHADTRLAVQALKLGAFDFIEKPIDHSFTDRVGAAIEVHERTLRVHQLCSARQERLAALTKREREVMNLVVQGLANKVIAFDLGLSEKTVEVHRSRVMHKLEVQSLAQLVRFDVAANGFRPAFGAPPPSGAEQTGAIAFAA